MNTFGAAIQNRAPGEREQAVLQVFIRYQDVQKHYELDLD